MLETTSHTFMRLDLPRAKTLPHKRGDTLATNPGARRPDASPHLAFEPGIHVSVPHVELEQASRDKSGRSK